jgi:hypothetical protein
MRLFEKLGFKNKESAEKKEFKVDENYNEVFQYEFLPTFDEDTDDYMIRFHKIKNADQLIGKLLIIFNELEFQAGEISDMWMNDEIWISAKTPNGSVMITRDIYDFVFIMGNNNKSDLDKVENVMNMSADFERIEIKND